MSLASDPSNSPARPSLVRWLVFYGLVTCGCALAFLGIRAIGETLPSHLSDLSSPLHAASVSDPSLVPAAAPAAPAEHVLPKVLLALAAVILVGRGLGSLLARFGQPAVIGEVLAGIVLGPSLLGALCQGWGGSGASPLLPPEAAPYLAIVAQLGVILYMFLIGVEFNAGVLRAQAHAAIAISHASIVAPFLLGTLLALPLFGRLAPAGTTFTAFALFMGVALSVTAFPVLARILTDRGIARTRLGVLALSCAAVDDVTAWCLLALVAAVIQSQLAGAAGVIGLSLAYIAAILVVVRPLACWLIRRADRRGLTTGALAMLLAALLLSALATDWIGIHAVFGAFLLGVIIPHDSQIARALGERMEHAVTGLLLPAFFAFTGMRTQIGLVSGWEQWLICGLIILVASLGKFGGAVLAARWSGLDWRLSSSVGILMNTRGLMELIVLNIGLDLGVISPTLFAMMVLMALVTTLATTPLLGLVEPADALAGVACGTRIPAA
jgi:Kef-type K+ transport system membrane component KefB